MANQLKYSLMMCKGRQKALNVRLKLQILNTEMANQLKYSLMMCKGRQKALNVRLKLQIL